eukprot:SAG31_NODE_1885_length_6990_cov_2.445218_1_plen_161_part_00
MSHVNLDTKFRTRTSVPGSNTEYVPELSTYLIVIHIQVVRGTNTKFLYSVIQLYLRLNLDLPKFRYSCNKLLYRSKFNTYTGYWYPDIYVNLNLLPYSWTKVSWVPNLHLVLVHLNLGTKFKFSTRTHIVMYTAVVRAPRRPGSPFRYVSISYTRVLSYV